MFKLIGILVLALALTGAKAEAAMVAPPIPPGITLSTNDSACGEVTISATGIGVHVGQTYQLVANQTTKSVTATSNTVAATFTRSQSGEWGQASIRTAYGGYLETTTNLGLGLAWYHVRAC